MVFVNQRRRSMMMRCYVVLHMMWLMVVGPSSIHSLLHEPKVAAAAAAGRSLPRGFQPLLQSETSLSGWNDAYSGRKSRLLGALLEDDDVAKPPSTTWNDWLPKQLHIQPRRVEFPSIELVVPSFNSSLIWLQDPQNNQAYLQRHQIVKKRRVLKRSLEIARILSGQILRPLLCSVIQTRPENITDLLFLVIPQHNPPPQQQVEEQDHPKGKHHHHQQQRHTPTNDLEADFWKQTRRGLTNAQRVARGIPVLGPTFVKLSHIIGSRSDLLSVPLAEALAELQDQLPPFENWRARGIIRNNLKQALLRHQLEEQHEYTTPATSTISTDSTSRSFPVSNSSHYLRDKTDIANFLDSLSKAPIASGSMAQVYKGYLPGYGPVAVKVLRPRIRSKVELDATLFHSVATWIESWNNHSLFRSPWTKRFAKTKTSQTDAALFGGGRMQLVQVVDEFTARVLEDMDFIREVENMKLFARLYDIRHGSSPTVKVVVPQVIETLCSERVIVMEWLEGTKLTDISYSASSQTIYNQNVDENLALIIQAMECTISQLIDHGLLHGEQNSANLLKVHHNGKAELGYLDFGLVSHVPLRYRDGIVCAVVQLVFARNIQAVADLCQDLELLPPQNEEERKRFIQDLQATFEDFLIWPKNPTTGLSTGVPRIQFENLLPALTRFLQSYDFSIPPYFFNNIRAMAALEGMALKLDPDFNILRVVYPYSINRLMRNPSVSARVQDTFVDICRSKDTKLISPKRVRMLLHDWALWTGYRKRRIFWDLLTSAGGRRVAPAIVYNWYLNRIRNVRTIASYCYRTIIKVASLDGMVTAVLPTTKGQHSMATTSHAGR